MKYCGHCGKMVDEGLSFCPYCGQPLTDQGSQQPQQEGGQQAQSASVGKQFVNKLNEYVGNDKPVNLNWKMLFTNVGNKHTTEEAEEIFICGTKRTTPELDNISHEWPHPWLYSRVFIMFSLAFFLLWICCKSFENPNALPGLIVMGSFTVPLSTMILFLEVNAFRDISLYKVIQVFFVGGCASLVATLIIFSIIDPRYDDNYAAAISVGVVEEIGKGIIVFFFLSRFKRKTILGGMLIGASVGAGFAAFESAGYAMNYLFAAGWDKMMDVIFLRGFLAPGGHVTWAAITGAALVIASKAKGGIFDTTLFTDGKFWRLFILPIAMHATWDSPLTAEVAPEIYLVPVLLTILVWIIILILINMGLGEIGKIVDSESTSKSPSK